MRTQNVYSNNRPRVIRALSLFLALAFLAAVLPTPSLAASASKAVCASYYTVRSGDSLYRIADVHNVSWRKIAEANNIIAPYTIYVGQSLCIPRDKVGDVSGAPRAKAASFSVLRNGNYLVIRAYDFPTKSSYYVKVDDARVDGLKWYKLGMLRTRNASNVETSFELPRDLGKAYYFNVCLKNSVTDKVTCKPVYALK